MAKKQFKTESKRILDMMINSVYTNKEIFLRELISNASDAIDKLCYRSLTDDSVTLTRDDFEITISSDKDSRTIKISDNGIGMTKDELENNLGVIASSGSLKFKNQLSGSGDGNDDVNIIGQFGVGFYSAFMVSREVEVISMAYGCSDAYVWRSSGADGYTVAQCEKDGPGTDIILHIKDDGNGEEYSQFLDDSRLKDLVKKYSDYIRWPVKIGGETVNSMVPIWQRSKSQVSDEDCKKFYKETYHDAKDPIGVVRINAEGAVSFKALLFIPGSVPFDYYTAAYKPGLTLYSNSVMIMDKCPDLLPDYFRFVCGVVDSPDLSLNISREILQQDRQLKVIAGGIERRIRSELSRILENNRADYEEFFKNFGLQLKYGVVADYGAHKDLLKDLLLFFSEKKGGLATLSEYVSAMPEDQKYIYCSFGETVKAASGLPQTEPVRKKGYDILCLTDSVDEFVTGILGQYSEKQFKSVNDDDTGAETESDVQTQKVQQENSQLLDFIKDSLEGKVAAVKISRKLDSYPVCLSTQGMITLEMEKYFSSLPGEHGDAVKAERVLEINPNHKIFETLKNAFDTDKEKAAGIAKILYGQAEMIAGYIPEDPAELSRLISDLIN